MTNEALALLIREGGNDELIPVLWDKTKTLIQKKCFRYWNLAGEKLARFGCDYYDLRQEGYNVLMNAVKAYDEESGYKLNTYLNYSMKNVIRGMLKGKTDVLNRTDNKSLDEPLKGKEGERESILADIIPDENCAIPFETAGSSGEYGTLYKVVSSLPEKERLVIREYYFNSKTFAEIGRMLNISGKRVHLIKTNAIALLRSGERWHILWEVYGAEYGCPLGSGSN